MAENAVSAGSVGLPAVPEPPDHDVRAVLAIVPFRRLWLALGLSSFGDWLGLLATTSLAGALATGTSGKLLAVSGVFILRLAPAVLFGPLAGVVADRLDRRWTLVYGDVLRFLLFCTIPLVGTLWWLFVATILIEIVGLFWMPAKEATMPNLVPRNRLEAANQLSLVVTYGSAPIAAVAFSGLTLASGVIDEVVPAFAGQPTYLALYVNALTFLVSAIVIWRLDFPPPSKAARQESLWRTAVEGWRYVGTTPLVRGLVLGMLGAFAAGGTVIGLAQAFVADLKAGSPGYGTLFGAVFIGLALGMWVGPRLLGEFSRRRLFGLSIAAAGGWLVLLSLVPNIVLAVFLTVGLGACAGVAWVTGYTLLGLEVGDEVRGRTFAFLLSMVRVVLVSVLALGPAIAALLSQALSLPHTLRINEHVALTYTGVMATFLLAGLAAIAVGVASFRQMDDRAGVSLRADFAAALKSRQLTDTPSRRSPAAGVFVAFEGGDGAGKSTQVRLLGDWLHKQGYEVLLTHEPGATPAGAKLRELLLAGEPLQARAEALLFAADRAQHVETVVRPALERGAVVVTDRYIDSSVAYQGTGRDLGVAEVSQLSRWATGGLEPDLTVLLDIAPDVGRDRREGADDRLEAEPDEFHTKVRERFVQLAGRAPSRYLVLDAAGQPDELGRAVVSRLAPLLPESPVARATREQRLAAEQAAQRAEEERVQAAMQRLAEDRTAAERAEVERLARVQEALEQAAREKAGSSSAPAAPSVFDGASPALPPRPAARPSPAGGLAPGARERAARDKAAEKRAAHEAVARDQAARDQAARERTAAARAARERAIRDQAARDQAARDESARHEAARAQVARDQAARDQAARDEAARVAAVAEAAARARATLEAEARQRAARAQAARDRAAREQAMREAAAREQLAREQKASEQRAHAQVARERALREAEAQERAAREQAAREQAALEQAALEQAAREQAAREQALREQAAERQAAQEQAAREQALREQAAREQAEAERQAARERAAREQAARDQAARQKAAEQERAARQQEVRRPTAPDKDGQDAAPDRRGVPVDVRQGQPSGATSASLRQATTVVVPVVKPTAPLPVVPSTPATDDDTAGADVDVTERVQVSLPDDSADSAERPGLDDEIFGFGTGRG